ncbi:MAG: OsmC family protein [Bacteroidia bacterium]
MKIEVKRLNDKFRMEAKNEDGNLILMDGSPDIGGEGTGFRPMQLLLAAVGGCSSIDILLILNKQKQIVQDFKVEIEGVKEKVESHSIFKDIVLHYKVEGEVELEKVHRAIKLSLEKYCSVSKTLEAYSNITYKLTLNGNEG